MSAPMEANHAGNWFVEETFPDLSRRVVASGVNEMDAVRYLRDAVTDNRLEAWTRNIDGEFEPISWRNENDQVVRNGKRGAK